MMDGGYTPAAIPTAKAPFLTIISHTSYNSAELFIGAYILHTNTFS